MSKDQSSSRFKWMLVVMATLVLPMLFMLGLWQLDRAEEKRLLLDQWQGTAAEMSSLADEHINMFSKLSINGHFDRQRWILLDNKTRRGRVGYEVIAIFYPRGVENAVLVNMGWIIADVNRQVLPEFRMPVGELNVVGRVTVPSKPLMLKAEELNNQWPWRLQRLDMNDVEERLGLELNPWVIRLSDPILPNMDLSWTPSVMSAEKHTAYALQWFLMAFVLILLVGWGFWQQREEGVSA